jgi:hypothetical protein
MEENDMTATIHTLHQPLEWREAAPAYPTKGASIWRALSPDAMVGYMIEGPLWGDVDRAARTVAEYYEVSALRKPIGNAPTLEEAKALAQRQEDARQPEFGK